MSTAFNDKRKLFQLLCGGCRSYVILSYVPFVIIILLCNLFLAETSVCDINSLIHLAVRKCIIGLFDSYGSRNFILRQIYKCQIGHNHYDQEKAEHCNRMTMLTMA